MRLSSCLFGFAATSLAVLGLAAAHPGAALEPRGEIHDIMHIIESKKCGDEFCSSFIHIGPPKTTTKTITKTVFNTVPSSTKVQTSVFTKTASAITKTSTNVVTVKVTPTVSSTVVVPIPSTATVATITSVVTATSVVATETITSFTTDPVPRRRKNGDRIPSWLHGYCADSISKACSKLVHQSTCTKTKTITTTKTVSTGVSTIKKSSSVVVTPTSTAVVTVSTTATQTPPVTVTATVESSSLVPVTATDVQTTVVSVTATQVITLPSPNPVRRGNVKVSTSDGSVLGYIGPIRGGFGTSTIVSAKSDAITVTFLPDTSGGLVNLAIVGSPSHPYLGAVFGQNGNNPDLTANSGNRYLNMGEVDQVPAGSQSASSSGSSLNDNGLGGTYESQIWAFDSSDSSLTIVWYNSNGTPVRNPSLVNVDLGIQFLEWTLDTDTFENSYSGTEVFLSYESL